MKITITVDGIPVELCSLNSINNDAKLTTAGIASWAESMPSRIKEAGGEQVRLDQCLKQASYAVTPLNCLELVHGFFY
jgi:hypothetical protein